MVCSVDATCAPVLFNGITEFVSTSEWKEIAAGTGSIPQTIFLGRRLFKIFKYETNLNKTQNIFPTV